MPRTRAACLLSCLLMLVSSFTARTVADDREGVRRQGEREGQGRSVEGERRPGGNERDASQAFDGFRPRTARERQLFEMLKDLQDEVASLRRAIRETEQPGREQANSLNRPPVQIRITDVQLKKHRKVFEAYDKDGDRKVTFKERLGMKNYEVTGQRLLSEKLYHLSEDLNRDGWLSLEEFVYNRIEKKATRWQTARLVRVDTNGSTITIEPNAGEGSGGGSEKVLRVEPKAVIAAKGVEVELGELRPGQPVNFFMAHDGQTVIGLGQR